MDNPMLYFTCIYMIWIVTDMIGMLPITCVSIEAFALASTTRAHVSVSNSITVL